MTKFKIVFELSWIPNGKVQMVIYEIEQYFSTGVLQRTSVP